MKVLNTPSDEVPQPPHLPTRPFIVTIGKHQLMVGKPLTDRQWDLMDAPHKEQCIGGGKRSAKTVGGAAKAIALSLAFPGNKGYILRQDLTDLKESTLETFLRICPPELIIDHNHTERRIVLRTSGEPSKLIYSGLSDEAEEESSKGKESGFIWIDEPSEISLPTYLMYLSQLCWTLPPCRCMMMRRDGSCPIHLLNNGGFPPFQAILTTNPESGWVEDRFRDLIEQASDRRPVVEDGKSRVFIRALPRDNPYLPPGWEEDLRKSAPEIWVQKYLDGVWGAVQGQVFKEFDKTIHGIPSLSAMPPDYLKSLKLIGCLDHATTGITCFRIDGIDHDGNITALASYYQANRTVHEHATAIKLLVDRIARLCGRPIDGYTGRTYGQYPAFDFFEYNLIDPATQAKTQMVQNELWSIQDMYWREGVPTLAAHNAMEAGVQLLQQYIHIKPNHVHPYKLTSDGKQIRPSPSYFIVLDENREGVRELIGWKTERNDRNEIRYKGPDHWIDCGRYIALSRPEPPAWTARDLVSLDTHSRKAQNAMAAFDKKFGAQSGSTQWFPGGTGTPSQWWGTVQ